MTTVKKQRKQCKLRLNTSTQRACESRKWWREKKTSSRELLKCLMFSRIQRCKFQLCRIIRSWATAVACISACSVFVLLHSLQCCWYMYGGSGDEEVRRRGREGGENSAPSLEIRVKGNREYAERKDKTFSYNWSLNISFSKQFKKVGFHTPKPKPMSSQSSAAIHHYIIS